MEVGRLYLDANVIIMLGEGTDRRASLLTELAAGLRENAAPFLCTSELTLAEVLVKPYREHDDRLIDQYEGWMAAGGVIDIGPIDTWVLRSAAALRSSYRSLKLPDAIHVSTAIRLGCSHLLTADERLAGRFELAEARHSKAPMEGSVDILRPDPALLHDILEAQTAQ